MPCCTMLCCVMQGWLPEDRLDKAMEKYDTDKSGEGGCQWHVYVCACKLWHASRPGVCGSRQAVVALLLVSYVKLTTQHIVIAFFMRVFGPLLHLASVLACCPCCRQATCNHQFPVFDPMLACLIQVTLTLRSSSSWCMMACCWRGPSRIMRMPSTQ